MMPTRQSVFFGVFALAALWQRADGACTDDASQASCTACLGDSTCQWCGFAYDVKTNAAATEVLSVETGFGQCVDASTGCAAPAALSDFPETATFRYNYLERSISSVAAGDTCPTVVQEVNTGVACASCPATDKKCALSLFSDGSDLGMTIQFCAGASDATTCATAAEKITSNAALGFFDSVVAEGSCAADPATVPCYTFDNCNDCQAAASCNWCSASLKMDVTGADDVVTSSTFPLKVSSCQASACDSASVDPKWQAFNSVYTRDYSVFKTSVVLTSDGTEGACTSGTEEYRPQVNKMQKADCQPDHWCCLATGLQGVPGLTEGGGYCLSYTQSPAETCAFQTGFTAEDLQAVDPNLGMFPAQQVGSGEPPVFSCPFYGGSSSPVPCPFWPLSDCVGEAGTCALCTAAIGRAEDSLAEVFFAGQTCVEDAACVATEGRWDNAKKLVSKELGEGVQLHFGVEKSEEVNRFNVAFSTPGTDQCGDCNAVPGFVWCNISLYVRGSAEKTSSGVCIEETSKICDAENEEFASWWGLEVLNKGYDANSLGEIVPSVIVDKNCDATPAQPAGIDSSAAGAFKGVAFAVLCSIVTFLAM